MSKVFRASSVVPHAPSTKQASPQTGLLIFTAIPRDWLISDSTLSLSHLFACKLFSSLYFLFIFFFLQLPFSLPPSDHCCLLSLSLIASFLPSSSRLHPSLSLVHPHPPNPHHFPFCNYI